MIVTNFERIGMPDSSNGLTSEAGADASGGDVVQPQDARDPEGADQNFTPCDCEGDCSPTCSCKKIKVVVPE